MPKGRPRGLSQAAYARHANVSPTTVGRWIRAGRISLEADGGIDPDKADRQRIASESPLPHHQARKAQIDAEKARAAAAAARAEFGASAFMASDIIEEEVARRRAAVGIHYRAAYRTIQRCYAERAVEAQLLIGAGLWIAAGLVFVLYPW